MASLAVKGLIAQRALVFKVAVSYGRSVYQNLCIM